MAWSTPMTAVSGTMYTAAQYNTYVRDNLLETGVAKVTAAGQMVISTGPQQLAARGVAANRVTGGSQQTAATSLGDNLTTVGPTVTLTTGSSVLVLLTAFIMNTTAGGGGYMGYLISGSTSIAGTFERSLRLMSGSASERSRATAAVWQTGLTPGSNTFKAQYSAVPGNGGNADFDEREIAVIPLS